MTEEERTLGFDGVPTNYVSVPLWVVLDPGLSPEAKVLYAALLAHRGPDDDETVWPGREQLAAVLGLGQARSVDRYVSQLVTRGAVTVERRQLGGLRVRNHYLVRWHKPAEHDGPRSLREFRARREGRRE